MLCRLDFRENLNKCNNDDDDDDSSPKIVKKYNADW